MSGNTDYFTRASHSWPPGFWDCSSESEGSVEFSNSIKSRVTGIHLCSQLNLNKNAVVVAVILIQLFVTVDNFSDMAFCISVRLEQRGPIVRKWVGSNAGLDSVNPTNGFNSLKIDLGRHLGFT